MFQRRLIKLIVLAAFLGAGLIGDFVSSPQAVEPQPRTICSWSTAGVLTTGCSVGIGITNPTAKLGVEHLQGTAILARHTAKHGNGIGVWGESAAEDGAGVVGKATAKTTITGHTVGVWGESIWGAGVKGIATSKVGTGVVGVWGESASNEGAGVVARATATDGNTFGVWAQSTSSKGTGVFGKGREYGVFGDSLSFGVYGNGSVGVFGKSDNIGIQGWGSTGVSGKNTGGEFGHAGRFDGRVKIVGDLTVTGKVSKGGGLFKIDHPLDPANKYLSHSFVESPDMKNVYDGVVTLDEKGEAWVELPSYFEALNRDFRYLLTPIGAAMPNLYIAEEIKNNRFKIVGGKAGKKASWQVTGIRKDPFALAHPVVVNEEKPEKERGYYLHPEVYGQPKSKSIECAHRPGEPECVTE